MTAGLRALGWAQGLLLGLVIASTMMGAGWLPLGVQALFLIGAFQLRLADRRWTARPGLGGWISHIRMAPTRLLFWAATAFAAVPGRDLPLGLAVLVAAMVCELLVYPLLAPRLGGLPRAAAMLLLAGALALGALPVGPAASPVIGLCTSFVAGMAGCMVWLRGPDGEWRSLALSLLGMALATAAALIHPPLLGLAWPAGVTSAVWALAHGSILRRRPLPWREWNGAVRFRLRPTGLP